MSGWPWDLEGCPVPLNNVNQMQNPAHYYVKSEDYANEHAPNKEDDSAFLIIPI